MKLGTLVVYEILNPTISHIVFLQPILGLFTFGTDSACKPKNLCSVFDVKDDREIEENYVLT